MNKATWQALPAEIQKTINEINEEWSVKHGEAWDSSDTAGRELFGEKGTLVTLSPEETTRWQEAVKPAIEKYSNDLDEKGFNGKEIIDYISSMLN
jgi:TRAP-type C4-dicarboxylate transport system substrate-binding protein